MKCRKENPTETLLVTTVLGMSYGDAHQKTLLGSKLNSKKLQISISVMVTIELLRLIMLVKCVAIGI